MLSSMPPCVRCAPWLPLAFVCFLGCQGNDQVSPSPPDIETLFWDLRLSHHAVTLSTTSPYDTLTLLATPRNHRREPLAGLPSSVYTTSDPRAVVVTSDGKLQAVQANGGVTTVTATLTVANVKHTDLVYVQVVDDATPPVLGNVSIHPLPPDSAKRATMSHDLTMAFYNPPIKKEETGGMFDFVFSTGSVPFPVRTTDTANNPIPGFVYLETSDPEIAKFLTALARFPDDLSYPPWLSPLKPGVVALYASATMFGVTKVDTLQYEVGWPLAVGIIVDTFPSRGPGNFFRQGTLTEDMVTPGVQVRIGTGGVVGWKAVNTPEETELVFDDPTNVRAYEILASSLVNPNVCNISDLNYPYLVGGCSAEGNFVLPGEANKFALRVFPVPGVYEFHNARNGARGRVIVGD